MAFDDTGGAELNVAVGPAGPAATLNYAPLAVANNHSKKRMSATFGKKSPV